MPGLADLASPLRSLTHKECEFEWNDSADQAFDKIKALVQSPAKLCHFKVGLPVELYVDASPQGLGAILVQDCKGHRSIVSCASRALSDVQTRYSQTEREALAIKFGIEKFHSYLFGSPKFTVFTDHKPLVAIFESGSRPPLRIERWLIHLQGYDFIVKYRPGPDNPADYFSRSPITSKYEEGTSNAEIFALRVLDIASPKAITLENIKEASDADPVHIEAKKALLTGNWRRSNPLYPIRHYLSEVNNFLVYDRQYVLPASLQQRCLQIAHEGHQGISRTKSRLRGKVWWPKISLHVETMVNSCQSCQVTSAKPLPKTPLTMTNMPTTPWSTVAVDLKGPLPSGETLLVVIDYHSRYPDVQVIRNTSSESIISRLNNTFSRLGVPKEMVSDNGPQFVSSMFKSFCENLGIRHRRITPLHPQANGLVERFMGVLGKFLKICWSGNLPWKEYLDNFLRMYRTTSHSTTGIDPHSLLFKSQPKDKIPTMQGTHKFSLKDILRRDQLQKQRCKNNADLKNRARYHNIKKGDKVFVKSNRRTKVSPYFSTRPLTVDRVNGNLIVAVDASGKSIARNVSFFTKPHQVQYESDDLDTWDPPASGGSASTSDPDPPTGNPPEVRRSTRNRIPTNFYGAVQYY